MTEFQAAKKGVLKLITPESGLRQFRVWFPTSITKLVIELNGSRCDLLALMELLYTTLCQTVRTGNGLNWSEVA